MPQFPNMAYVAYEYTTPEAANAGYQQALEIVRDAAQNGWTVTVYNLEVNQRPTVVILVTNEVTLLMVKEFALACRGGEQVSLPLYLVTALCEDNHSRNLQSGLGFHKLGEDEDRFLRA